VAWIGRGGHAGSGTCGSGSAVQDNPDGAVQIKVPGRGWRRRHAVEPFIR
jgi:hypothetical protein